MTLKRYFMLAAVSSILLAFGFIIDLWVALPRYGNTGTAIAMAVLAALLGGALPFFARGSHRPPNHPRIDHLRIAGKYCEEGFSPKRGDSPLHLA